MKNDHQNIPFLKTKIGLTLSLLIAVLLFWGLFGFLEKLSVSNKNKKAEQAKLEFYEEERAKIEKRLADINSEEGIDKTVRENYNLSKEGESLIVIIEEEDSQSENSVSESNFFRDFFRKIFNKKD
jgi:cell division protein FtsB